MKKRILAATLAGIISIGFIPKVYATESISSGVITEDESALYDSYGITYESNGSNYIKSNELRVEDGKMKIVTTFTNASMITLNGVTLNGREADTVIHEVVDNLLVVETVIGSLDDQINFDMKITVPFIGMVKNVDLHIKNIKLANGIYNFDMETNGAKYIKSKELRVEDGEMTVVTIFNMASMITVNKTTVNGDEVETVITNGEGDTLIIETPIESLDDDINFNMTITVPNVMTNTRDLYLKNLRLSGVDIPDDSEEDKNPPSDDVTEPPVKDDEGSDDDTPVEDNDNTNSSILEDGNYTIESNYIKAGTTDETSAASDYIERLNSLKVENGEYYLTLDIKNMDVISNIGATVDGKSVDVIQNDTGDGKGQISFKINSLKSNISINCKITVEQINFSMDTSFIVSLVEDTLKNEKGESVEPPDEDTDIPTYKDAVYTIENTISGLDPDSPIAGIINPKNTIKVEGGKIYVYVTFYKSGFMDGRIIRLNDNAAAARYSIEEDTANKVTVKINISSVNDKIRFSSKESRSLDDGFTLLLLKDTLKEEVSSSGSNSSSGSSGGSSSDDDDDDDDLDDGTYVIKNKVLKENSDNESYARDYVDKESILTVKNGKIWLTLKFTNGKMMSDTSIKVEGKKTSYTTVKKSGNDYRIKFKIGSIDDEVLVTTTIDTGVASVGTQKDVKFRVLLRESTLDDYDEDDDEDDEDDEDDDDDSTSSSNTSSTTTNTTITSTGTANNSNIIPTNSFNNIVDLGIQSQDNSAASYKIETYSVSNEIITDSTIGYQAARGALESTSYMQIVNGDKKYMVVNFGSTDGMSNIRFSVGGQNINYDILNQDGDRLSVRFEVPSISEDINVIATVPAIGRDISFGLKFDESTLTLIGTEESSTADISESNNSSILNNVTYVSGSSGGSFTSSSGSSSSKGSFNAGNSSTGSNTDSSESEDSDEEVIEAKEYYKKYTIENEVISDSMMGRTMARKYLNKLSTLDDIDGQLYLTLTFSGSDAMDDFSFTVNGENREYSVASDGESGLKSFKFKIDSVNDTIDVGIFIKPVKMNIGFGVNLLEDTMVLIDEGEISNSDEEGLDESEEFLAKAVSVQSTNSNNKNELSLFKIAITTSLMTTGMNGLLAGIIYLIIKRKKNKKIVKAKSEN